MDAQLNVLIIEDDPALRRLLVDVVAMDEHQVVAGESAEEALEALPFWTFQVAFLDHNLPGMEGLVLGQYLRRNNPDMSIVLVTGDIDEKLPGRAKDAGLHFLPKPFSPGDVRRLLEDYVVEAKERHRLRMDEGDAGALIADYAQSLVDAYSIPKVPGRIESRIVDTLKRSLHNLRSTSRYTERDRVIALGGLLAAKVLGMELPRARSERTLWEEYDALMRQHGRQEVFRSPPAVAE